MIYEKEKHDFGPQRAERLEDCVEGQSLDGEGKSVVRKKTS